MNMSLERLDTGVNIFRGDSDGAWSSEAYGFVAGLLRHAPRCRPSPVRR